MTDKRIYHNIANKILELLNSGEFPAGSRLPAERDLALRFGVSRPTIREAKILLQAQGRIEIKLGSGSFVGADAVINLNDLSKARELELIEARALIEAESAALAAPIITDETLLELETYTAIMSGKVKSNMSQDEAEFAFHNTIAQATNNHVIMFVIDSMCKMRAQALQLQHLSQKLLDTNEYHITGKHLAILCALKNKDAAAARKAMRAHFTSIIEDLIAKSEEEAYQEIKRKSVEVRSRYLLCTQWS